MATLLQPVSYFKDDRVKKNDSIVKKPSPAAWICPRITNNTNPSAIVSIQLVEMYPDPGAGPDLQKLWHLFLGLSLTYTTSFTEMWWGKKSVLVLLLLSYSKLLLIHIHFWISPKALTFVPWCMTDMCEISLPVSRRFWVMCSSQNGSRTQIQFRIIPSLEHSL